MNIKQFQDDLIGWFLEEKRDLPWRENRDPYRIWVSEIMLQQTKVDTVIPYFKRFMEQFPTASEFAAAEEETVLKAWEGLGYYSRVRNLHTAVKEVQEHYGGVVPDDPDEIAKLKGVGPYTRGAISSIAFGIPEPAVDGNVMRVLSRILLIEEDIAKPKTRKTFEAAVREIISHEDPSSFNQGLMELGALICTPKSPSCLLCPVQRHCKAFHEGIQDELPVKKNTTKVKTVAIAVAVLRNDHGEFLLHKRGSEGLLANFWEFPNHETESKKGTQEQQLKDFVKDDFKVKVEIGEHLFNFTHVFSHLKWNLAVYSGQFIGEPIESDLKVVGMEELEKFPFPVPHLKIIKEIKKTWQGQAFGEG